MEDESTVEESFSEQEQEEPKEEIDLDILAAEIEEWVRLIDRQQETETEEKNDNH